MTYKVPVIIGENHDYVVYFEPSVYGVLVHCDVRAPWSKSIKCRLQVDWWQLLDLHRGHRIIARHLPEQGDKHKKFLKMMGFTLSHSREDFDVYLINGGQNEL